MIEDIVLEPVSGAFDVAEISVYLESMRHAARDPHDPRRFFLSSEADTLGRALEKRLADETATVSYQVTIVFPVPECVLVSFRNRDTTPARTFIEWLRTRQPIKILDEVGNDLSDRCRENLDFLFA